MVNRDKLAKAEEKLTFAEFLTRAGHSDSYSVAAVKHVTSASTLAVQALTDTTVDSPRAMQLALLKFEEPEAKLFAKKFMTSLREGSDRQSVKLAMRDVREFVNWVKTLQ